MVPYLKRLGISHCYASPLLQAREGSQHGYDISDHRSFNVELGSREDFIAFAEALQASGMSLVLDIVPNHMGAGRNNPWWMDVLENGLSSLYAGYFDVDWNPLTDDLRHKILLPILGASYGQILRNGEIQLAFDPSEGRFWFHYYENVIPVNPASYPNILSHRLDVLEVRLGGQQERAFLEYRSIINAFEHLPIENGSDVSRKQNRNRERRVTLERLVALCQQYPDVLGFIEENVRDFQPHADDPSPLNRLHRLMEMQVYRLSNWRVASDEINYRRFFDVNDLVAVRVEDAQVFQDTHALILEAIEAGWISGLRIDHPDGLNDPAMYFRRLQEESAKRLQVEKPANWQLSAPELPLYVLIEKILAPFERLPQDWPVHGTTGYEFANIVNGLWVDSRNEKEFTRQYERILGFPLNFDALVQESKKLIMRTTLNSELGVLTQQLYRICKQKWGCRDYTLHNLRTAIMEIVASFPVYRTYVTQQEVSKKDREYIDWAISLAKRKSLAVDTSIFDFIRSVLLLEEETELYVDTPVGVFPGKSAMQASDHSERVDKLDGLIQPERLVEAQRFFYDSIVHFAMKFQQYTGPVMAKGMEDTAFYRYNRLISLNEVGSEPKQFGISAAHFHHWNLRRQKELPGAMLSTSTHDTKRSEDVRARISVLSELPEEWFKHLNYWRRMHRHLRRSFDEQQSAPSENDEVLFYQTLLGIWPFELPSEAERAALSDRLENYMIKAAREAKVYTSWINPNQDYEDGLKQYIQGIVLKPAPLFLKSFIPFQRVIARHGLYNGLSQTLLKLTCPGVPDIYQGCELWDWSLVDPDNRRPVDYAVRQTLLDRLSPFVHQKNSKALIPLISDLTRNLKDGGLKLLLTHSVLQFREAHSQLFLQGSYIPLEVAGTASEHVLAFARLWQDEAIVVVVPRFTFSLRKSGAPCGKRVWRDTVVSLTQELEGFTFKNGLTDEPITLLPPDLQADQVQPTLEVAEILKELPIGFLTVQRMQA